ncbi:Hypothetical protein SRAE_1000013600 [Strongyloides ratti]|uniref:Sugar transporter SWEET1 n=1 Tax=Strongyloides ratti TaxID=34506 RepID=A0A090KWH3_STRRB|nr:Hypothetical protein SRAE_1000013600 [Strongyloides ratti]CEF61860.1 Hypothetical protein SRAE_1000013600 [Strongyloides ratti]
MNSIELFGLWLAVFSIGFTFLPIFQVLEWKKRGSSDGFSSINLVLPMLMMSCWFKHGILTNDKNNMMINGINLICFTIYVSIFAYYQSRRRNVLMQVISLITTIYFIFNHVDNIHPDKAPDVMGSIAAGTQIFGMIGGIYDLLRAIKLGTMEYIPAVIQFAIFPLTTQWTLFGYLINNQYMFVANMAGLLLNIVTIASYFVYPPLTWKVPIFGIEPQQKIKKKITSNNIDTNYPIDCPEGTFLYCQHAFNKAMGIEIDLTWKNISQIQFTVDSFMFQIVDNYIYSCQKRREFYNCLGEKYTTCINRYHLLSKIDDPTLILPAYLYSAFWKGFDFSCNGGLTTSIYNPETFNQTLLHNEITQCQKLFLNDMQKSITNICLNTLSYMNCMQNIYTQKTSLQMGWFACEKARIQFADDCPDLRCLLIQ